MIGHCNTNNNIKKRFHDPLDLSVMPKLQTEAPNFSIEGSPTGSAQLQESPSLQSCPTHVSLNKSTGNPSKYWGLNSKTILSMKKEIKTDIMCSKRASDRTDKPKSRQRTGKELYQSKNVFIERNRRQRIKDGLFTLRALVPKISKVLIFFCSLYIHFTAINLNQRWALFTFIRWTEHQYWEMQLIILWICKR